MRFIKYASFFILTLFLFAPLTTAAEPSQFSLIVNEYGLPLSGNSESPDSTPVKWPEALDNVLIGELPQPFKDCVDGMGNHWIDLFGTDEYGNPNMTWEDASRLTFTGPYYLLSLGEPLTSADPTEFRKSISDVISLRYLIRLDGRPASNFTVSYDPDAGSYTFKSIGYSDSAEALAKTLDSLSVSDRYTDDVFFLSLWEHTFIVNVDDQIFHNLWMEKPTTFINLINAEYTSQLEINKMIEEHGEALIGGSSLISILNDYPDGVPIPVAPPAEENDDLSPLEYEEQYHDNVPAPVEEPDVPTLWIIIGASAVAALSGLILLARRK